MSLVDLLFRLQQFDDETRADKIRLGQVLRSQGESEELKAAQKRVASANTVLLEWRVKQKDLNLELSGLDDKAKRAEQRLYSGVVKNPKELSDLQLETESLARRRAVLEDDLLEAMINVEEAQEEEAEASTALARTQTEWDQNQAKLKAEQASLLEHIQALTGQRKQLVTLLTSQALKAYENAGRRAGITAVVSLRNGRCLGCQVTVPINLVKAADEGELVNCDSCSRILCPV